MKAKLCAYNVIVDGPYSLKLAGKEQTLMVQSASRSKRATDPCQLDYDLCFGVPYISSEHYNVVHLATLSKSDGYPGFLHIPNAVSGVGL